jgi:hypothetical protein
MLVASNWTRLDLPNSIADLASEVLQDFLNRVNVDNDYVGAEYFMTLIDALAHGETIIIRVRDRG